MRDPAYLYVAAFADGLVKVGATEMPEQRRLAIRFSAPREVGRPLHWFQTCALRSPLTAEARLIELVTVVARRVHGREWFDGITFEDAERLARRVERAQRRAFAKRRVKS